MHPHDVRLHLRYTFERGEQRGAELGNPLFELLAAVVEGALSATPRKLHFLACLNSNIEHPAVQRLRAVLVSPHRRDILLDLSGYRPPTAPGGVLAVEEALPWWGRAQGVVSRRRQAAGPWSMLRKSIV